MDRSPAFGNPLMSCGQGHIGYEQSALGDVFVPRLYVRSVRVIVDVVEGPDQLAQRELVVERPGLERGAAE